MTQEDTSTPAWRTAAEELSDEIRAIIEALAVRELRLKDLSEAKAMARSIRRSLEAHPPRPRWYEADEEVTPDSPGSTEAYLQQSPVRGQLNPIAPPLDLETLERPNGSRAIAGRARLGKRYEGPPHGVHGGWLAAIFDELLGAAQGLAKAPGVTAILRVRYRHLTPIDEDLRLEAWIADQRQRRLVAKATCHAGDTLTADAEGTFMRVDFDEVQKRMRERREQR
jgi:acyl-coenzyme A thioesterase PaaI-like protein